jgi:hypothetical protein
MNSEAGAKGEKESTSCRLPLRGLSSPTHRQGLRVEQRAILARTRGATAARRRKPKCKKPSASNPNRAG